MKLIDNRNKVISGNVEIGDLVITEKGNHYLFAYEEEDDLPYQDVFVGLLVMKMDNVI